MHDCGARLNGTEPLPSSKPLVRLHDIAANVRLIDDYMDGLDFALFKENLVRDAVERCLLRISEAAAKLGTFAEEQFPDHNWAGIRAMGNILRHEYDNVDAEIIWNLREDSLPGLLADVEAFLSGQQEIEAGC